LFGGLAKLVILKNNEKERKTLKKQRKTLKNAVCLNKRAHHFSQQPSAHRSSKYPNSFAPCSVKNGCLSK
jgi:hypothetical protein